MNQHFIFSEHCGDEFDLDGLHSFFTSFNKNIKNLEHGEEVVVDLSGVIFWEITAVLWLIVVLDYYKKMGQLKINGSKNAKEFSLKLKLPQISNLNISPDDIIPEKELNLLRSADFLKRWKVINALKNLSDNPIDDPLEILVDSQKEYYSEKPIRFYKSIKIRQGCSGLTQELISLSLVEIRNLIDFNKTERKIDNKVVNDRIDYFIEKAVSPVLVNQCGISTDIADKFVTHLLSEGLENALQHPDATLGIFAVSKYKGKLVLSIVDNGEPITKTIYPHYYLKNKDSQMTLPEKYNSKNITPAIKGKLITHATMAGVSRKHLVSVAQWERPEALKFLSTQSKVGEGLTHIRDSSVRDYKGNLTIESGGVRVKYTSTSDNEAYGSTQTNLNFPWDGNLVRIEMDLK